MIDAYLTIAGAATHRLTRNKSRFLARVEPARDEQAAAARLAEIRRQFHDATHHCHALRWLDGDHLIETCHDDGEPPGSAGAPMLTQLTGRALCNVLAVVVRYYGGSPLGVGGLIRAYSDAVSGALDRAQVVRHAVRIRVVVRFPSEVNGRVLSTLHRVPASIESLVYEDPVRMELSVPPSQRELLQAALVDATGARLDWEELP